MEVIVEENRDGEGHVAGMTGGFRSHGMWPMCYPSHVSETRVCGTVLRTVCPEDFVLLWRPALLAVLISLLI